MLVPNRHKTVDDYRYGFNGMEKDDEVKGGEGNSYDYGARMFDARIGRWFATDPKEGKYPNESPFIFVSNSPIVALDPDGNEKIVVSGGADLHNKNRMNFISAAKNQIKEYKKAIAKSGSKEGVSWLIFDKDFTSVEKKAINQWAKKNGVSLPIFVASADEVVNYINSKSTTDSKLTIGRTKDGVTALSFMAHGVPSAVALGYENTGWVSKRSDPSVFDNTDIASIESSAFNKGAKVDFFTCNAATPLNMQAIDYPTIDDLVAGAMKGDNLVKSFSNQVKSAVVSGFIGQTSYMNVGLGELPKGATLDGSYSPTVNGTSPASINVSMENGKIKKP